MVNTANEIEFILDEFQYECINQRNHKGNCQCGKPILSKGKCKTCYHRLYQRKRNGSKGPKKLYNADEVFLKVLAEVKKGRKIYQSCDVLNINRSTLYRIITPLQKAELNAYKRIGFCAEYDN